MDAKSKEYGVLDLARESPSLWTRLDDKQLQPKDAKIGSNKEAFSSEITDMAFQSKKTSAIISLNSSCREGREMIEDLSPYLRELLLGISDVSERSEGTSQIAGAKAQEATVAGKMAGERTKIRAVVLAKENCIYDLMYISRPDRFSVHESDFNRFISSLKLR